MKRGEFWRGLVAGGALGVAGTLFVSFVDWHLSADEPAAVLQPGAAATPTADAQSTAVADEPAGTAATQSAPAVTNRQPFVDFAHGGRYLPPTGARAIAIRSVNVGRVHAEIRRVPAANLVQMLALEEGAYDHIRREWFATQSQAEEFVESLSSAPCTFAIETANRLNEEETNRLSFVSRALEPTADGGSTNGIFLVLVRRADVARRDRIAWWDDETDPQLLNPARYRVVCVTDLGLSVRRTQRGVAVWITSFTTGRPVANAQVEVYSTANIRLGETTSDENGWCRLELDAAAEPFAVVARAADGDMSFVALRSSMRVEESVENAAREPFLAPADCTAFVWSERGIYRHGETIFLQALLRNGAGVAPPPFPVEVQLVNPQNQVFSRCTLTPDVHGALVCDTFSVPAEQMSGKWRLVVKVPGEKGATLGSREIKIEEFAPPQIRVKTTVVADGASALKPQDFAFDVTAEHLFGGAAKGLRCEGAVVFEDVDFAPANWRGYRFGDASRALKPNFRRLAANTLDDAGACRYAAPLWKDTGLPRAAVRCTAQGTVFEDGGRPATTRACAIAHYYPYYIGSPLTAWLRKPEAGRPVVALACVAPDGQRLAAVKRLEAKIERIDTVYSCTRTREGWTTWTCDHVRTAVADKLELTTSPDGDTELTLPIDGCGDYALTVSDPETDVCYSQVFYLSDWGDEAVRAPLSNPTVVTVTPDRPFYRVGDVPRLVVKSPFAGTALVTVCRDDLVFSQVLELAGATGEIVLPPVAADWAPNVEVHVSVVQALAAGSDYLAVRAHGEATVVVRPVEREIAVGVVPELRGRELAVAVTAPGATHAVVTVVDEGIHLLTGERTPDPLGFFARPRRAAADALYDLYHRLLPVLDADRLRVGGRATGGDIGAHLLGRVSPVPTRRFKPLALWKADLALAAGAGATTFALPEFAGELRVTVVAYSGTATGSAEARQKVVPKLVFQPDAPRFVAPGDVFTVSLPLVNRSGGPGEVSYTLAGVPGQVSLAPGETRVVRGRVTAPPQPGEMELAFAAEGFGERHEATIPLPVRPALAWREQAGVAVLAPGQSQDFAAQAASGRFSYAVAGSRLGELRQALTWLADYPHGCLEQTASRIFPLIAANGVLAAQSPEAANVSAYVAAGVRRVESMIRANDFVMWPDGTDAPWDREVSLYAAHFLVAAEQSGVRLKPASKKQVLKFLRAWALAPADGIAAYACHTLALAGAPNKDRMLGLYDRRADLGLLDRARLAGAFVAVHDRPRATELLRGADAPASVKEAAFLLLALLELDPRDGRLPALARYLEANRDARRFCWGTTETNAHALLALGAYYASQPVVEGRPQVRRAGDTLTNAGDGTAFVSWRSLTLPDASSVTNEASELRIERTFRTADGTTAADLGNLTCGDLLMVELKLSSAVARDYADLVIEDLLPGAFEPVHDAIGSRLPNWVMRTDARDDRMLVFSRKFSLDKDEQVVYTYPVRVVSSGVYALPAVAVEAMYQPRLSARFGAGRVVVHD